MRYFNRNSGNDYVDNHMCSQRVVKRVVQNLRESILTNVYNVLAYLDWTQERQDRFSPDDVLFRAVCQRNEELLVNKGFELIRLCPRLALCLKQVGVNQGFDVPPGRLTRYAEVLGYFPDNIFWVFFNVNENKASDIFASS